MRLDYTGQNAVVASWASSRSNSDLNIDFIAWPGSDQSPPPSPIPTLFHRRVISNASLLNSLYLSPSGLYYSLVYTLRHNGQRRSEVVRMSTDGGSSKFAIICGQQGDLDLPAVSVACCSDDELIIVTTNPAMAYQIPFAKIWDDTLRERFVDGTKYYPVDSFKMSKRVKFPQVLDPLPKTRCFEFSPDTCDLVLSTSCHVAVWKPSQTDIGDPHRISIRTRDSLQVACLYDKIVVSCSEGIHLLDRSSANCSRTIKVSCLRRSHFLRNRNESLQIIVLEQGGIACYTIPRNVQSHLVKEIGTIADLTSELSLTSELIGSGGYGEVYKALWKGHSIEDPNPVAVKMLRVPVNAGSTSLTRVSTSIFCCTLLNSLFYSDSPAK
jgi:hypothetical protein